MRDTSTQQAASAGKSEASHLMREDPDPQVRKVAAQRLGASGRGRGRKSEPAATKGTDGTHAEDHGAEDDALGHDDASEEV